MCQIAALVDCPMVGRSPTIGWAISANYQERDELDKTIREYIPAAWYRYWKAPEFRYSFVHGSVLRNVSADDPETLKRGRVDFAFYNEAQKMPIAALTNGIYGTADKGGIALLAANPPRRQIGEWVLQLKEAIDDKIITGVKFFGFSAKNNTQISQEARGQITDILRVIDPRAAAADSDDQWLPIGDRAYHCFQRQKHLLPAPQIGDCTAYHTKRKHGRAYTYVGGVDFQGTPHHAGVIIKVYGSWDHPIYHCVDEIVSEQSVEDDFLDDVDEKEVYAPENLLWIGDASGAWQTGDHKGAGRGSFDIFKKRRWHITPPRKKKTDRGEHAKNPHIDDRLNLVNKLLEQGRLLIDPATCPRLAEAIKECPLKSIDYRRKPYGRYSHITDAMGYALFWLEPRAIPAKRTTPGQDAFSMNLKRKGADYY